MNKRHFRNSKTGQSKVWGREGSFLTVTAPVLGVQVVSLSFMLAL